MRHVPVECFLPRQPPTQYPDRPTHNPLQAHKVREKLAKQPVLIPVLLRKLQETLPVAPNLEAGLRCAWQSSCEQLDRLPLIQPTPAQPPAVNLKTYWTAKHSQEPLPPSPRPPPLENKYEIEG